jgi:hypothetical protein
MQHETLPSSPHAANERRPANLIQQTFLTSLNHVFLFTTELSQKGAVCAERIESIKYPEGMRYSLRQLTPIYFLRYQGTRAHRKTAHFKESKEDQNFGTLRLSAITPQTT